MQVGDYVTHIDHGVGRFSGLEKMDVGGKIHEVVRLVVLLLEVFDVRIYPLTPVLFVRRAVCLRDFHRAIRFECRHAPPNHEIVVTLVRIEQL